MFRSQPVVFLHQDVSFAQYLALLTIADAFINASLREGMNVRAASVAALVGTDKIPAVCSSLRTNTSFVRLVRGGR